MIGQCDCSCASLCPLKRSGMAVRCTLAEIAAELECAEVETLERLHEWQKRGEEALDLYRSER